MKTYVYIVIASVICAFLIALLRSKRLVKGIALSSLGGLAALGAVDLSGMLTGVTLAFNLWTFLTAAVLGLPGVVSMLLVKLMWGI
ncbi:MAG TPA: pro-sigmaK processing inhibitor BofA family protein [Clostridia bacterium]|nr:pro-sigmaK processing inhibitor BofA family protein [Clostridia bacterium]